MKRKIFTTAALVCCIMVCFAIAADLTGKWMGILKTPDGNEFPINYSFKADGTTLTGVGTTPGGDVAITDGKIDGQNFSFTVSFNGADIKNTGKFYAEADTAGLDIDYNGIKMHATLKRGDK
jgi:hypothetical protein